MVDGFLGRWSQRKTAARQEAAPQQQTGLAAGQTAPRPTLPAQDLPLAGASRSLASASPHAGASATPAEPAAPMPTLQDVAGLTTDSDFGPFVARAVSPQVRNAAMKKLFADPHFNVMDGLDTYIDDYSVPDPLPLAMLRKMASAKFMQLVDDPAEAPDTVSNDSQALADSASASASSDVADVADVAAGESPSATPLDADPKPPCA